MAGPLFPRGKRCARICHCAGAPGWLLWAAMTRRSRFSYPRREFMRRAAAVSAAMAAPANVAAQSATPAQSGPAPEPSTTEPEPLTGGRAGSDFMVDTIKALGFEYICANPGSSFRGLHESVINYGG